MSHLCPPSELQIMKFYIFQYFASFSFLSSNILVSTLLSLTVLFPGLAAGGGAGG
jgi:hypothetical protein